MPQRKLISRAAGDDDTEGHGKRLVRATGGDDDTEGHRRKAARATGDDDTEGHRRRPVGATGDDTEGQSMLSNPLLNRQLASAREQEIQRNLKQRGKTDEARRPYNKRER